MSSPFNFPVWPCGPARPRPHRVRAGWAKTEQNGFFGGLPRSAIYRSKHPFIKKEKAGMACPAQKGGSQKNCGRLYPWAAFVVNGKNGCCTLVL
jgi:hypothetical protein